jgi:hypothetical protein
MAERLAIERDISKLLQDLDTLEGRRGLPSEKQQLLGEQIDRTVARLDASISALRALQPQPVLRSGNGTRAKPLARERGRPKQNAVGPGDDRYR